MADNGYLARQRVTMVLRRTPASLSALVGVASVAFATAVCWLSRDRRLPDVVMIYLLGVVVVAMRFGYAASLVAAALSVAALDFFFTEPYFSFAVADKRYIVTFAIMLLVATVISNLMQRIRRSAAHVREREVRTARLYAMSREVSIARAAADIVRVACRHVRDTFLSDAYVLLADGGGGVRREPAGLSGDDSVIPADVAAIAKDMMAASSTYTAAAPFTKTETGKSLVSLRASGGIVGVLVLNSALPSLFENEANRELLEAYASQTALAVERAQLAEEAQRSQVEVQRERLRNALLSSVSHDLRTPLAVVKGAVTALLDPQSDLPATRKQEYLETISDEASRLNRLVRNLLNMTSLEAGALRARKEWQPIEEVVGVALNRLEEALTGRPVRVQIDPDANLAPFDATLVEQVLLNLIENALRYTPAGTPIEIRARSVDRGVEVEVADRGPGIPAGQEEQIFEKFRRAAPRTATGMGLGLTICRGILTVHGGSISCENRQEGGASFRFVLPREDEAPPLDGLPEAPHDP